MTKILLMEGLLRTARQTYHSKNHMEVLRLMGGSRALVFLVDLRGLEREGGRKRERKRNKKREASGMQNTSRSLH